MTSLPDPFFRDHLEHFQKPAPASAWDRVESRLDHRRTIRSIWIKIAAGIILLLAVSIILWPEKESAPAMAYIPELPEIQSTPSFMPTETPSVKSTQYDDAGEVTAGKGIPKPRIEKPHEVAIVVTEDPGAAIEEVVEAKETVNPQVEENKGLSIITMTEPTEVPVPEASSVPDRQAGTTLVYEAHEVNSRFMKKESIEEATLEAKKTSGIQKLADLANSIKHQEYGLGSLRQKKNEILTLAVFDSREEAADK